MLGTYLIMYEYMYAVNKGDNDISDLAISIALVFQSHLSCPNKFRQTTSYVIDVIFVVMRYLVRFRKALLVLYTQL